MMTGNLPPFATQRITVSALAPCRRLHFARPATFVISASFGEGRHAGA
jgi:hypothetical protein